MMQADTTSKTARQRPLFVLLVLLAAVAARAGTLTKGPCLLRVYQDRVALMWETDRAGPWRVHYNRPGTSGAYVESVGAKFEPERKAAPRVVYIHKVWIEHLRPGQHYQYRIAGAGGPSDTYTFRTVPSKVDEVTFIVYGDSRSHPDRHRRLVERMIRIS